MAVSQRSLPQHYSVHGRGYWSHEVIFCGKSRKGARRELGTVICNHDLSDQENIDFHPLITPADVVMDVFAISMHLE
jgi:hypothetical protein